MKTLTMSLAIIGTMLYLFASPVRSQEKNVTIIPEKVTDSFTNQDAIEKNESNQFKPKVKGKDRSEIFKDGDKITARYTDYSTLQFLVEDEKSVTHKPTKIPESSGLNSRPAGFTKKARDQWIHWDDGTNYTGIGTGAQANFNIASRWYPVDLTPYGGLEITQISFFPCFANCIYTIKIWTGTNATEVYSQVVTSIFIEEWNVVNLNVPHVVNANEQLWFGLNINTQGGYPAGADEGPQVAGKGNMIYWNDTWQELTVLNPALTYNWNIQAFVETATPPPPYNFYESFENFSDFTTDLSPWTTYQLTTGNTYSSNGFDFPGEGTAFAFMVFNPSQTTPSIVNNHPAVDGNKYAIAVQYTSLNDNKWLISPAISINQTSQLSFWAKSITDQYGLERIRVLVSTTGTEPSNFTQISSGNYMEVPTTWTQYTYSLGAYDGQVIHIAIQYVSYDAFFLMVDSFQVIADEEYEGCSGGTQYPSTVLTPTTSWQTQTQIYAGEYSVHNVTNGQTYIWSLCSADGGNASYDSEITLINHSTQAFIAYSDDPCGDDARVEWTATFTGQVRVLITEYNCNSNSISTTLAYKKLGSTSVPTISTNGITNITQTTATGGGNVTSDGGATVTARGVVWSTWQNPTITNNQGITSDGTGTGSYTSNLTDLQPATFYYVRAYATNSAGTGYGNQLSFYTLGETYILTLLASPENGGVVYGAGEYEPDEEVMIEAIENEGFQFVSWTYNSEVVSYDAYFVFYMPDEDVLLVANFELFEEIPLCEALDNCDLSFYTDGSASWYGQSTYSHDGIDAARSGSITHNQETWMQTTIEGPGELSFWWSVSSEQDYDFLRFFINNVEQSSISGSVDWHQKFYSLGEGTYTLKWTYSKDISVNSGMDCGLVDQVVFSTGSTTAPTVVTSPVTSITQYTATSGGEVTSDGGAAVTARGVVWSTSPNPTITANQGITSNGTGTGSFTSSLTGLTPQTTYYVRAYATNSVGTAYGNQLIFNTLSIGAYTVSFNVVNQSDQPVSDAMISILPSAKVLNIPVSQENVGCPELVNETDATLMAISSERTVAFEGKDEWIHWDSGVNTDAIGTNGVANFHIASRWYPADLTNYNGMQITKVSFFPNYANCVYTVKVWVGANAVEVYSQVATNVTIEEWNIVELAVPVEINGADQLWFGVNVNTQGGYPAGCDDGPQVAGKGNMIYWNNTWQELTVLNSSLTYNWNIQAYVEEGISEPIILYTDSNGQASFSANNGSYNYTVEKVGYNTYAGSFTVSNSNLNVNVTLEGEASLPSVTTSAATSITHNTAISGGNVTSDGGATVTARGVVWSTSTNPTIAVNNGITSDGTGAGSFTSSLTGLTPQTTYYVRAYATNNVGTAYGNELSFTTLSETATPTVTTTSVSNISQTSATGGGNVTSQGGSAVIARGIVWSSSQTPTLDDNLGSTNNGSGTGSYTSNLVGLTANTVYYVRAYATNGNGTAYGNQVSFTTSPNIVLPTVYTISISNVTQTTATGGGNITSDGGSSVYARGVVWSTNQNPTLETNLGSTNNGAGTGSYTCSLTGLTPQTTYYVRAYATNSLGASYGAQEVFTTLASILTPTVTTNTISNITQTTATSGGSITADGGAPITSRGVFWSTLQNPTLESNLGGTTDGTGMGTYVSNIAGLTPQTTYYVRAYAINSAGISYGNQEVFTTLATDIPENSLSELEVFPNPFTNSITLSNTERVSRVAIVNLLGQSIIEISLSSQTSKVIDTKNFSKGVYVLRIYGSNDEKVEIRMVKN